MHSIELTDQEVGILFQLLNEVPVKGEASLEQVLALIGKLKELLPEEDAVSG